MDEIRLDFETLVETRTFVGIDRGIEPYQDFLGGAGFRPSTVGWLVSPGEGNNRSDGLNHVGCFFLGSFHFSFPAEDQQAESWGDFRFSHTLVSYDHHLLWFQAPHPLVARPLYSFTGLLP